MSERAVVTALGCVFAGLVAPGTAGATGYDPYAAAPRGPIEVDMAALVAAPREPEPEPAAPGPGKLPPGWVQLGEVVQREAVAMGIAAVAPEPSAAWEDTEGNQYPRKHTLFLNFGGGTLYGGEDNSAEDKSALARAGHPYPASTLDESAILAMVQAVKEDMAGLGVVVVYEQRPSKTVPYTMVMVSGDWTDANLDSPAGGVAPGVDCEARGQRHVVFVFDDVAWLVSQEAAHAWGLDHTLGDDRIMSYTGGLDRRFGDNCQPLCEEACQGPGSIGCRLTHEKHCGEGSEQQNDLAELAYVFGTDEPDTEPPEVDIVEPAGDVALPVGSDLKIVGFVHDNFGGVGWRLIVKRDGKTVMDEVDYEKALAWGFKNTPEGLYEVVLEAEDHFGHVVQDRVIVTVGSPAPPDPETTGGSDDGGSETGVVPTSGGVDASSGGGDSSDGGDPGGDDGGCRISPGGGGPAALLVPVVGLGLAWRARRRR